MEVWNSRRCYLAQLKLQLLQIHSFHHQLPSRKLYLESSGLGWSKVAVVLCTCGENEVWAASVFVFELRLRRFGLLTNLNIGMVEMGAFAFQTVEGQSVRFAALVLLVRKASDTSRSSQP